MVRGGRGGGDRLASGAQAGLCVADRADLEFTYSLIDRIFRLSLGELADFSGAKYDGDFSLSLEEAQRRKHDYVAEQIGIGPGRRVLDLGCGWGALLDYVRERGGIGVGVTLSSAQLEACRRHGLDVHLVDARQADARGLRRRSTRSRASARSSTSARPRSTAPGGRRRSTAPSSPASRACCPSGGRLYLQTMVFGRNMIPARTSTSPRPVIRTPGTSRSWAVSSRAPGCRRAGAGRPVRRAAVPPGVGRQRTPRLHPDDPPVAPALRRAAAPARRSSSSGCAAMVTSSEFRLAFTSGVSANTVCFERELMDHYRLVFERTG